MKKIKIKVTTAGSSGSATGNTTSDTVVQGWVTRVDVNYHASAPATTDLTLVQVNELIADNIVSLSNTATDVIVRPTVQLDDNAGTGLTYDGTEVRSWFFPVADKLKVTLAQCDALTDAVEVDIYYQETL